MRLRILLCVMGIAGFLISSAVNALGLGEITVKSQLNEPLNAEIRLLKVGDLSKEEVLVFLASREDFSRAGVDRLFFLNDLQFDVFVDNPAYPYIRVVSTKPVVEPFLNFLVDVQWPTGRLVREYTLLLDIPTFSEQAAPEVVEAPVRATPVAPQPSSRVAPARPQAQQPSTATTADRSVPGDSYRVQRGDTLWEIAARSRPSGAVSVNQTMLAIQRLNPEAFISDNINLLQSGKVLRIPSESEINQINDSVATEEVKTQNRVWSGTNNTQGQAALTSSSNNAVSDDESDQPSGRLSLGSADSGSNAAQGSGNSASGTALQNELAIAQEELDRSDRENSELKSRITELEEQIRTMEQLISVSNDQLRALELSVQDAAAETSTLDNLSDELTTAADEVQEGVVNEVQETINDSLANEPVIDPSIVDEPELELTPPAIDEPVVIEEPPVFEEPVVEEPAFEPTPAPAQSSGLMDILKEKWKVILGALGGLLLLILLLLKMRKSRVEDDDGAFDFEDDNDFIDNNDIAGDDFADLNEIDSKVDDLDLEDDIEAETEDVVAEADIYVSLGQEDKAIELLQKEIQQNPGNADARLGLLGIYAAQQNVELFDDQYAQLLPLGDTYATDQAKELREQMADATPFDEDSYSIGDDSSLDDGNLFSEDDELDLDLDLDDNSDFSVEDTELEGLEVDIEDDDFLGAPVTEEFDISTDETTLETSNLANDLDDALEMDTDNLLDEIAEAADVDDEGLASDLDDQIEDLDDLDLDLDFDDLEETAEDDIVEFDLDDDSEEIESLTSNESSLNEDLSEGLESIDESLDLESTADTLEASLDAIDEDVLDLDDTDFDELSLELGDDLEVLADEVSEEVPVDNDMLNTLESADDLDADALISQEDVLPNDIDFEEEILEDLADENKLNFDESMDLDIDDLDQEIDAMTADLDDNDVSLSQPETDTAEVKQESEADDAEIMLSEDDDLSFLDDTDEVATKLDLAKAYIDMGDNEGAQDILNEVLAEGNEAQIEEASALLKDV